MDPEEAKAIIGQKRIWFLKWRDEPSYDRKVVKVKSVSGFSIVNEKGYHTGLDSVECEYERWPGFNTTVVFRVKDFLEMPIYLEQEP